MSAPRVLVTCCGEEVPETEIPPSFLEKGIRRCRRCASGQGVSPQQLPDRLPVPTPDEWEGYLRRSEIRREVKDAAYRREFLGQWVHGAG